MLSIFKKIFPSKHEKDINSISPVVDEINVFYEEFESLSDEQLKEKTNEFKQKIISETEEINNKISELQKGLTDDLTHNERMNIHDEIDLLKKENYDVINAVLDEILPEAFAVVKQTCKRLCGTEWEAAGNKIKWNMVPYDVQLIGGVVLHQGKIAEMATGEGKTLVATLPLYLNALAGKGVHLITVNDYLAKRDSEWMGEIFKFLGLTIGVILNDMDPNKRREMYNCDITYGTNNEFGFDYLRDNMVVDKEFLVQREHFYAIVDEVDSVLIDEARTPLIISGPVEISKHKYDEINPKIKRLVEAQKNLVNKLTAEAEAIVSQENVSSEDSAKAGLALLRANHALPNHKKLQKLLSEPSNKKLLLASEAEYMRDNSKQMHIVDDELYFIIEEKSHVTDLTEKGREFLAPSAEERDFFTLPDFGSEIASIENNTELSIEEKELKKDELSKIYAERSDMLHTVHQLLKAYGLYDKDVDYVVQDSKVMIVDEFTGRILSGRRYSDGLHQAIEAKEGVHVEKDSQTLATITLQNYFRLYKKLAGMTGTAETESSEFFDIYKLDVTVIPTNRDCVRDDLNDLIYRTKREKYNAVIDEIAEMRTQRRPVLVGTTTVEVSETISRLLKRKNIPHEVLNAKQHAKEAHIVENAGLPGAVTIATNMAGRGTDIKLGPGVADSGGLHIIGTERHESRRIDRQLRGRAGRQGDPGASKFYLSLEDELMRLFGNERIANVMERLGFKEGESIEHKMITNSVERAQKKVEENNYAIRKRLLEYDNVMNQQREVIYSKRRQALTGERLKDEIFDMVDISVENTIKKYYEDGNIDGLIEDIQRTYLVRVNISPDDFQKLGESGLKDMILNEAKAYYNRKEERYGSELMGKIERFATLSIIDEKWKEHLREMDDLKEGISFRAYAQKDPLLEYKSDGFKIFVEMLDSLSDEIIKFIFKFTSRAPEEAQNVKAPAPTNQSRLRTYHESAAGMGYVGSDNISGGEESNTKHQPVLVGDKIGRNDPCHCGSGKKFKNCHGRQS
ncbi:MAG TPA: preprotein translocase subunit SecA [Ignavibacteria bacterium]|nr:preprotein translocase subunit SecA [Ignavibacteria bacterium]HQY52378.1 preprotein translocase subunit SecA [Ignavibacteria bacterium]HRB01346.1 preprotein translocase subunit SecA [Ignavibacteria bacterium]